MAPKKMKKDWIMGPLPFGESEEECPTSGSRCLSLHEAADLLREADAILSQHDGIHRLHGVRACLLMVIRGAGQREWLNPQESANALWAIGMMRYAALRGFLPPGDWRPAELSTPAGKSS